MAIDTARQMLTAIMAGDEWPPEGIPPTPANEQLWSELEDEVNSLAPGQVPDIPADWTEDPASPKAPAAVVQAADRDPAALSAGFDKGELRDEHGEWTRDGGGAVVKRNPATGRVAAQTPSQFVHPDTGHLMGKTEIGDTFEALFKARGAHLLTGRFGGPYQLVAHADKAGGGRGSRTTPLDFMLDHSHGGELKTLNVSAKSQKTAIKAVEVQRKDAAAKAADVAPLLAVQVVDPAKGQVEVYAYPAFASKTTKAMEHLGSYSYSPADFQAAQEATGHWAQRHARAEAQLRQRTTTAAAELAADPPPADPAPQPGDTVIELRDGVPYISTHPSGHGAGSSAASGDDSDAEAARFDPDKHPRGWHGRFGHAGPHAPAEPAPPTTTVPDAEPDLPPELQGKWRSLWAEPAKDGGPSPLESVFTRENPHFTVTDRGNRTMQRNLRLYQQVPAAYREQLGRRGVGIYFGGQAVPMLDDLSFLHGQSGAGHEGTFDDMGALTTILAGGAGKTDRTVMALGTGNEHSISANDAAHEAGHAIDFSTPGGPLSSRPEFQALYDQAVAKFGQHMSPYYRQPGGQGARETFGESFAAWTAGVAGGLSPDARGRRIAQAVTAGPEGQPTVSGPELDSLGAAMGGYFDGLYAAARSDTT